MKWGSGGGGGLRGSRVLGLILGPQGIVGISLVGERLVGTLGALENYDFGVLGVSQESRLDSGLSLSAWTFLAPCKFLRGAETSR